MNLDFAGNAVFFVLGGVLGAAWIAALAWNVELYCGKSSVAWAVIVHLVRFVAIIAALVPIARAGAVPLVLTLAAFELTRLAAVRFKSRAPGVAR
jgi:hypothetical protein